MHPLKSIVPRRVAALRAVHRLSLRALAREAGIAGSTLHTLESGFSADLRLSTLLRICDALSVTPDYLLGIAQDAKHARSLFQLGVSAKRCDVCLAALAPSEPHRFGACICQSHQRGATVAHLAARYGMCRTSIERILRDEYALLR